MIRHYGGMCLTIRNDVAILDNNCNRKFVYINNTLKDVSSGKCLHPEYLNDDATIKVSNNCSGNNFFFEHTEKYSIKHLKSGKCLHPRGGSPRPRSGTPILLHSGCGNNRLRFYVENGKHSVLCIFVLLI